MLTEKEKYIGIYSSPKYKHYGREKNFHGKKAIDIVLRWKPKSVIDVGCGYNEFVKQIRNAGIESIGIDFACPGADMIADAQNLPFKNKQFDTLTSFDMLEHLLPNEVDPVLKEFARVSERFIFSICYRPSVNKWQGENLHPTVMPESQWVESIKQVGGIEIVKEGRYIVGKWKF